MRLNRVTICLLVAASSLWTQTADVSFQRDLVPVLEKRCVVCHQGEKPQKGLRLTSAAGLMRGGESGPAVIAGSPGESLLLSKVSGDKPAMPPLGEPLTASEIKLIRGWIVAGAVDDAEDKQMAGEGTWWSLRPFQSVEPTVVRDEWARHEIDHFVLAKLREKGLEPSGDADRRSLIRRVKFDLLGLPPTPEEVDTFVGNGDPAAYEKLVDRFLGDPAYGERWGRHWLDVVRFGESNGYEQNHLRENAWPYRDWVIRSLNEDKPFSRMIVEQLAGDQVAPGDLAVEAATGFLVAGPHDTVKIQNLEGETQKRANHLDDMVAATASAFLGLTVHCARCHDHKFDPIQQKDYYRMQAAFAGVWHGERRWADAREITEYESASAPWRAAIEAAESGQTALRQASTARVEAARERILKEYRASVDPAGTEESFAPTEARFVRLKIEGATAGRRTVDLEELEVWTAGENSRNAALTGSASAGSTRVEAASPDTYSALNLVDGKFDKRWISSGGMPEWVMVELADLETIARVKWSSDRLMGFGGRFGRPAPEQYEIEVSIDGEQWHKVASSQGRLPYAQADRERLLLFAVFSSAEKQQWDALDRKKAAASAALKRLEEPAQAFLGRFEQPSEPSFVMVRGNPMDHGDTVSFSAQPERTRRNAGAVRTRGERRGRGEAPCVSSLDRFR